MDINKLYKMAQSYEKKGCEHAPLAQYYEEPGRYRNLDICAHLHREVSELWNAIRKQQELGSLENYEDETLVDELADILCIWLVAVHMVEELTGKKIDLDKLLDYAGEVFQRVGKRKFNIDLAPGT